MRVSFWNRTTGEFRKGRWALSPSMVALNTPEGFEAIEGEYDYRTQRIDVENMPEGADPRDHVVALPEAKRDVKVESLQQIFAAQRTIEDLEKAQQRPMRELALDPDNRAAKDRVQAIESLIAEKRLEVARNRDVLSGEQNSELAQKP